MFEDLQQDGIRTQDVEVHVMKLEDSTRKRRRPRVPQEDFREWTHEETKKLCELWKNESILYDHNHPKNHIKEERDRAIKRIAEELSSPEDIITENNVICKMSSLRAYYSGQLSKIKRSKQNEDGEPSYQSHWKFMEDLEFLMKAIVPRNRIVPYSQGPSLSASNKSYSSPENHTHFILEHAEHSNGLDNTVVNSPQRVQAVSNVFTRNVDESFCNMIQNILTEIPPGEVKDMLKLKIHQQAIEAKYKSINSLN